MFSLFPFSKVIKGTLVKRYKRFLADVEILTDEKKEVITVHCPNSGGMQTVKNPGLEVWLTPIESKTAKLKYRWQCANLDYENHSTIIGVDTHLPNKLIEFYLQASEIDFFKDYDKIKREFKYDENSKIDFLLTNTSNNQKLFLEIKNVHLMRELGSAEFPDGVTSRGAKHMHALARQKKLDDKTRCVVLYLIQRNDCIKFKIADDIDPNYRDAAEHAKNNGVEFIAFNCNIDEKGIKINKQIDII